MIDFTRDYSCKCGHSEYGVDPKAMRGHWLKPVCPACGGNMTILPTGTTNINKRKGSLGNPKRYNNPDGEVAQALKAFRRKAVQQNV